MRRWGKKRRRFRNNLCRSTSNVQVVVENNERAGRRSAESEDAMKTAKKPIVDFPKGSVDVDEGEVGVGDGIMVE